MTTLLASGRRVGWVRGVLLVATLIIAVLVHHGVEHGVSTGSSEAAMPGMATAVGMTSHHHVAGMTAEASNAHMGCAGDQMCEASGISKTPGTAHPAAAESGIHVPQPQLAACAVSHDYGAAAPPPTSAVLRI